MKDKDLSIILPNGTFFLDKDQQLNYQMVISRLDSYERFLSSLLYTLSKIAQAHYGLKWPLPLELKEPIQTLQECREALFSFKETILTDQEKVKDYVARSNR